MTALPHGRSSAGTARRFALELPDLAAAWRRMRARPTTASVRDFADALDHVAAGLRVARAVLPKPIALETKRSLRSARRRIERILELETQVTLLRHFVLRVPPAHRAAGNAVLGRWEQRLRMRRRELAPPRSPGLHGRILRLELLSPLIFVESAYDETALVRVVRRLCTQDRLASRILHTTAAPSVPRPDAPQWPLKALRSARRRVVARRQTLEWLDGLSNGTRPAPGNSRELECAIGEAFDLAGLEARLSRVARRDALRFAALQPLRHAVGDALQLSFVDLGRSAESLAIVPDHEVGAVASVDGGGVASVEDVGSSRITPRGPAWNEAERKRLADWLSRSPYPPRPRSRER